MICQDFRHTMDERNIQSRMIRAIKRNNLLIRDNPDQNCAHLPKWWDDENTKELTILNNALKKFRENNSVQNQNTYTELKLNWCKMKKEKKASYDKKVLYTLSEAANDAISWNIINNLKRNLGPSKNCIQGAIWETFFVKGYTRNQLMLNQWLGVGIFDPLVDGHITTSELDKALNKLKKQTSAGPDLIPAFVLKNTSKKWRELLLQMINHIYETQCIQKSWTQTKLIPIYKEGALDLPENYRPIAVINLITKILTAILANRLMYWAEINSVLQEEQNAFRMGRSTSEHIFVLKSVLQVDLRITKKSKLYVAFIDLKKAYDSVVHELLWNKLHLLGLSPRFINIIKIIYNSMEIAQNGPHRLTTPIQISKGVLQGDPMSAVLFNLFLADLDAVM